MTYTHRRIQSISLMLIVALATLLLLDAIYYGDQQSIALRLKDQFVAILSQLFPGIAMLPIPSFI